MVAEMGPTDDFDLDIRVVTTPAPTSAAAPWPTALRCLSPWCPYTRWKCPRTLQDPRCG
jgi:hypothetical protein